MHMHVVHFEMLGNLIFLVYISYTISQHSSNFNHDSRFPKHVALTGRTKTDYWHFAM